MYSMLALFIFLNFNEGRIGYLPFKQMNRNFKNPINGGGKKNQCTRIGVVDESPAHPGVGSVALA